MQIRNKNRTVVIEVRPAAKFELTPEEYKRIKEEIEQERRMTQGYYNDPEHFYDESTYKITNE